MLSDTPGASSSVPLLEKLSPIFRVSFLGCTTGAQGDRSRRTSPAILLVSPALTRKALELALASDPAALRLCLDRTVVPRRERSVDLALPSIRGAADILGTVKGISKHGGAHVRRQSGW